MRITLADYWMGREYRYPGEITPRIRANAALMVERANDIIQRYADATGDTDDRRVNSGWRPRAVNQSVPGSKPQSKHLSGEALDLSDDDGSLDGWLESPAGLLALEECGLWLESPAYTNRWCHIQIVPPKSGNRIFIP